MHGVEVNIIIEIWSQQAVKDRALVNTPTRQIQYTLK